jgi:DNA-binding transcriptional LysR family regulator
MKYIYFIITITHDYGMIDAELYRVFHIVAGCGNISTAAGQLFVSQPAVSKSIKKLEDLTGCTLFVRSSKGVKLTTEGRILFDYVKNGFEHLMNGEQVLKKIQKGQDGLVKVGISNTLCRYYFMPHLEEFHRRYPGIRIAIVNRTSPETLKLLEQGLIDFGIISIPQDTSRFTYHELLTIQDVFVTGGQHPELQNPVSLECLSRYPLMMLETDNVSRIYVEAYLAENRVALKPEIEISNMDFLIEFAKIGLGVAVVIKNFIKEELQQCFLTEIPVTPPIPSRKIGIVTPENLPLSTAAKIFIDSIREGHTSC